MRQLDTSAYRGVLRIPDCWTVFTFEGKTYEVVDGQIRLRPVTIPHPKPGKKRAA